MITIGIGDIVKKIHHVPKEIESMEGTVITLYGSNCEVMFDEHQYFCNITTLELVRISLSHFEMLSSDEQLEYLKLHPELQRQFTVSWIGVDNQGKVRSGLDRYGAIQTLIEYQDPSNGILAESLYGTLRSTKEFLNSATILNFWEV